jgi:hypothetical protein
MSTQERDPARDDVVTAANEILVASGERGAVMRALGGVAIALRCRSARPPGALTRSYSDIDFVARRRDARAITSAFVGAGFGPAERFNAIQAGSRMQFDYGGLIHADVFLEEFRMCHRLRLGRRLSIHERTVSLADLLLTKLQVAKLSSKDVSDLGALLLDHDLTDDESGINSEYVRELLTQDWGWWRTATETLARVESLAGSLPVDSESSAVIVTRAAALHELVTTAHKGVRWRARAVLGERRPWREDPEEVAN